MGHTIRAHRVSKIEVTVVSKLFFLTHIDRGCSAIVKTWHYDGSFALFEELKWINYNILKYIVGFDATFTGCCNVHNISGVHGGTCNLSYWEDGFWGWSKEGNPGWWSEMAYNFSSHEKLVLTININLKIKFSEMQGIVVFFGLSICLAFA